VRETVDLKKQVFDPLLRYIDLPYSRTYNAVGFPVTVVTNSLDVLQSAEESWGMYEREFDREPPVIRIVVQSEGELAPEPTFRAQGHLLSIVSDRDNHASLDMRSLFSCCFVSRQTAADHAWFRWFFLEPLVYMALAQRYVTPLHAACIERDGAGILLCGVSTAGKSTLAFACARAGWTFVSDDSTLLVEGEDRLVLGKPHQARFREDAPILFPELRGYVTRARPNGKLSIEVPMAAFPYIRTGLRSRISCLAFLDRRAGEVRLETMSRDAISGELTRDTCPYGEEAQARQDKAMLQLLELPAYRLQYEHLSDAIELLSRLAVK
jgi:hypothetical protein